MNSKERQRQRAMEAYYKKMNAVNNAGNSGNHTPQVMETPVGKVHTANLGKAIFIVAVLSAMAYIVVKLNADSKVRVDQQQQQLEQKL